jgi:transmembrane sensor
MTHFHIFKSIGTTHAVICAARDWVELFEERDPTAFERMKFLQWLGKPKHERAFATETTLRSRLRDIPERARNELISEVAALTARRRPQEAQHQWTRLSWVAATACVVLAVGATWMGIGLPSPHYATGVGQKLVMYLADGTHVELGPQTDLKWIGSGRCDRRVKLTQGEALFSVHDDPRCPFRVFVGRGSIEVLGTQFDVHQDSTGENRVSVVEGRIRLHSPAGAPQWQIDLNAGQQAVWNAGPPRTRNLDDTSRVTAWRDDRLDFDDQPLAQVVEDLQRYTPIPIKIADKRLLSTHVTGELQVDQPHIRGSVLWLGQWPGIAVEDSGRSLILKHRS